MDNSITKAMGTELSDQCFISGCGRTRFSPVPHATWEAGSVAHVDIHWSVCALFVRVKQT